jgi:hypothetical protein
MAGQNTSILASDYNTIQTKIARVLGSTTSDGDYGYGQTVLSGQVDTTKTVTVAQWNNLRSDLLKARGHQTGVDESASLTEPTSSKKVSESIRLAYATMADTATTNRLTCASNRALETDIIPVVVKNTQWNGSISHMVLVNFDSYDAARYFFNAGGEIRFSAICNGGQTSIPNSKDWTWAQMFSDMTQIKFGAYQVTCPDASATSIVTPNAGFFNMNTTSRMIYNKAAPVYSVYSVNDYFLYARFSDASRKTLEFIVTLADSATTSNPSWPAYSVDENITGNIYSYCKALYPTGSGQVTISPPPASTTAWA